MNALFRGRPLSDYLELRTRQAVSAVQEESAADIRTSAPDVAARLIDKFDLTPLQIDAAKPKTESFEATLEEQDSFNGATFRVQGLGVRATVPLTGVAGLLDYKLASSSSSGTPRANFSRDTITVEVTGRDLDADTARNDIRQQLQKLQQHLDWANAELSAWRPRLGEAVRQAVGERAQRLKAASGLDNLFDGE